MMTKRFSAIIAMILCSAFLFTTGCANYEKCGAGEVVVVRKGAFARTEGGGILEKIYMPRMSKISGALVDATPLHTCVTPQLIFLDNVRVLMQAEKNQEMYFDIYAGYHLVPKNSWRIQAGFTGFAVELQKTLQESTLSVLRPLKMGIDIEAIRGSGNGGPISEFADRTAVANMLFKEWKASWIKKYGEFADCIVLDFVTVGNVDYPKKVLEATEKAVAQQYETEVLKVDRKIKDVGGQIRVKEAQAANEGFGIEAGSIKQHTLEYMGIDLIGLAMEDPNTEVTLVFELDERGNIEMFTNIR